MPNWVECELEIKAKDVESILSQIRTEEKDGKVSLMDFNKIIPMPDTLHIEEGSVGCTGWEAWHGDERDLCKLLARKNVRSRKELQELLDSESDEYKKRGDQYQRNLDLYGHKTWYTWSIENWGTKWNACDVGCKTTGGDEATLVFSTAWSPPLPVIDALGERFPEADFSLKYWEHGAGFAGTYEIEQGVLVTSEEHHYSGSRGG